MNKIYHCIWSETLQTWVAASEKSAARRKSSHSLCSLVLAAACLLSAIPASAQITVNDGDNIFGSAGFTGGTFNLSGDAKIFGGSQSYSGTVTFNGQPGGSTITLNNSGTNYSKLSASSGASIVGNNVTFTGGYSTSQGGALTAFSSITLAGSHIAFSNNSGTNYGGAIHVNNTSGTITVNANKFTLADNQSTTSGGGIWTNGNISVSGDLDLIGNISGGYGGAIRTSTFNANNANALFNINNNRVTQGGSGINADKLIGIAGTVNASGNIAQNERGGVLRTDSGANGNTGGDVNLSNVNVTHNFSNNKAGQNGGAISVTNKLNISGNVVFNNNTAGLSGGAINVEKNSPSSIDIGANTKAIEFSDNKAGYNIAGTPVLNAGTGGAIHTNQNLAITGNNIQINNNISTGGAGAFYTGGVYFPTIGRNLAFSLTGQFTATGNQAQGGNGGFLLTQGNFSLAATNDSVISGNSASGNGGAIYHGGANNRFLSSIVAQSGNITFFGNTAGGIANAIYFANPNNNTTLNLSANNGRTVNFRDPVTGNPARPVTIAINSNFGETGTVRFSGEDHTAGTANVQSAIAANTTVHKGTFEIKDNAEYGLNLAGTSFIVDNTATLLSSASGSSASNWVNAGAITFNNGATISGKGTSTLNFDSSTTTFGALSTDIVTIHTAALTDKLTLPGQVNGNAQIAKTGAGKLTLLAAGSQIGSVDVQNGSLNFDQTGSFSTTGDYTTRSGATTDIGTAGSVLNIAGKFEQQNASMLKITIGATPDITASNVTLGGNLDILGFADRPQPVKASDVAIGRYTVIQSTNDIQGDFSNYVNGNQLVTGLDYLLNDGFVTLDKKRYELGFRMAWKKGGQRYGTGNFTLAAGTAFDVDTSLSNQPTPGGGFISGWDGTTLTKLGSGTLHLNAVNTYTGLTDIQAGKLIIGSTLTQKTATIAGDVHVRGGATLAGHGKILGNVHLMNGSTIAPGNSVGDITVGNITFDAGSTYEFEANEDTTADRITSTGNATINGGTVHVLANGNIWRSTDIYTLITTANGVTGTFHKLTSNLAFLDGELSYDAQNVYLKLKRNGLSMGNIGGTENQSNTGLGIQSLGPGNIIHDTIVSMDAITALNSFDNLSGEIHANAQSALLSNSRYVRAGVNQHLLTRWPEPSKNLWAHTWAHGGKIKNDGNAQRTKNKGFGILIGADYPVNDNSYIGLAAGYEETNARTENTRQSSANVDAYHLMLYGKTTLAAIDLRAGLGYAYMRFDTERNITVQGLQSQNTAKYSAHQLQAFIEGSHTFAINDHANVIPYLNLSYARLKANDFNERGGITALTSHSRSNYLGTITAGVRADMAFGNDKEHQYYADLGAIQRFGDKTPKTHMNFIGGTNFTIKGTKINRVGALIGAGAKFELHNNLHLTVGYEGELGSRGNDHAAKATLQWKF